MRLEYRNDDYLQGTQVEVREIRDFIDSANLGFYPPHKIGKTTVVYGLHGGAEWSGSSYNKKTGILYTPVNQTPWKLRVEGVTNKKYEYLPIDFQSSWAAEYQVYNNNCGNCHTPNRSGIFQSEGEKEVAYRPSLIGLALLSYEDANEFKMAIDKKHRGKFEDINYQSMFDFFKSWDSTLQELGALNFEGGWSYLLTSKGNFATDLPYGKVVATNVLTGKTEWEAFLGSTDIGGKTRKGKSMFGGLAGTDDGLLYVTGTDDGKLYLLDQSSGHSIDEFQLSAAGSAPPTIFSVKGKTHVAILSTGGRFHNYKKKGAKLHVYFH